jgi:hypothetical protein
LPFLRAGGIFLIAIGAILLGVVLMLVTRWQLPAFFTTKRAVAAGMAAADTIDT